jgi:hypothetical protein
MSGLRMDMIYPSFNIREVLNGIMVETTTLNDLDIKNLENTHNITKQLDSGLLKRIILELIIRDGSQSNFSIRMIFQDEKLFHKFRKIDKKNIHTTLQNLLKEKHVGFVKFEPKRGGNENFFGITNEGIQWFISKYGLQSENLWNLGLNSFNSNYKFQYVEEGNIKKFVEPRSKISLSLDSLFDYYETTQLKINKKYFNQFINLNSLKIIQSIFKNEIDFKSKEKIEEIIESISLGKDFSLETIAKQIHCKVGNKNYDYELIHSIISFDLIHLSEKNDKFNAEITVLGLLFLLLSLSVKLDNKDKKKRISSKIFHSKIDSIFRNNKNTLPLIFPKWGKLLKLVNNEPGKLLQCLSFPTSINFKKFSEQYQNDDELACLSSQYHSEQYYHKILREEYEKGKEILVNWAKNNNCLHVLFDDELKPRQSILRLCTNFGGGDISKNIDNIIKTEYKKLDNSDDDPLLKIYQHEKVLCKFAELHLSNNIYDYFEFKTSLISNNFNEEIKPITSTISFYFYMMLKITIDDDEIWNEFLHEKENSDLMKWWNEWIDTIDEFDKSAINERNSKLRVEVLQ